jgi:hypothetical protein
MVQGEPEVRGVEGRAHAGDAEVEFKMPVGVQRHAGHVVAASYAEGVEGMSQLAGPLVIIGVIVTEDFVIRIDGNHFLFREIFCRPQKKRPQQQWIIHHRPFPPFLTFLFISIPAFLKIQPYDVDDHDYCGNRRREGCFLTEEGEGEAARQSLILEGAKENEAGPGLFRDVEEA